MGVVHNWMEQGIHENDCTLQQREFENKQAVWRNQSNIVVHKYIDDLAETKRV